MSRAEEIAAILEDTLPRLEALGRDAQAELDAAKKQAAQNVDRHAKALEQLAAVEAELSRLGGERDRLPVEVTRANLDEDWQTEDKLKDLYRDLGREIGDLGVRRDALREELANLAPRGTGDPRDATIEQYAVVARAAHDIRADLEGLRDRLTKALDAAVDPVVLTHENTRGLVVQLGREKSWDESPAGRGGVRA